MVILLGSQRNSVGVPLRLGFVGGLFWFSCLTCACAWACSCQGFLPAACVCASYVAGSGGGGGGGAAAQVGFRI